MKNFSFICCLSLFLWTCSKKEPVTFTGNDIPLYDEIPTLKVENYVNRIFIDLLGREPLDVEMAAEVSKLEAEGLSFDSRATLIDKLMFSEDWLPGDSSYNYAYFFKIYEDTKARLIEGVSDSYLTQEYGIFLAQAASDSSNGNSSEFEQSISEANNILRVMTSRELYRNNEIGIDEMYRRMMNNSVYNQINMNSFNFVNASFDDLFFRFPTASEFESAYTVIEFNQPAVVLGSVATNKYEYLDIFTTSDEFEGGMIRWAYITLLSREPNSFEIFSLISDFSTTYDLQEIQKQIMITDEYAGFD